MRTVRRQSSPVSTSHRTIADGSVVSLMLCSMRSRIGHVALLIVFAYSCMRTVHGQLVSTAAETFGRQDVDGQSRWIRADTLLRWSKPCAPQTNSPRLSAGRWVVDTFGRPQGERRAQSVVDRPDRRLYRRGRTPPDSVRHRRPFGRYDDNGGDFRAHADAEHTRRRRRRLAHLDRVRLLSGAVVRSARVGVAHRLRCPTATVPVRCLNERMCAMNTNLSAIPVWVVVVLVVLSLAQITLDVVAFLDLYRRPSEQVVFGNKWIWVAIVLLVNTVGAILYLVVGRKPAPIAENAAPSASPSVSTETIADTLYGPLDDTDH